MDASRSDYGSAVIGQNFVIFLKALGFLCDYLYPAEEK